MFKRLTLACLAASTITAAFGQNSSPTQTPTAQASAPPAVTPDKQAEPPQGGLKSREDTPSEDGGLRVAAGTHILLNMINSVSTKQAQVGDRIYLETAFPVAAGKSIVIPQGSWVTGTIMAVKRPGRGLVKARGELQVNFDSLTLPNGVNRSFKSDLGSIDARSDQNVKREKSTIRGTSDKAGDLGKVIGTTASGTVIGTGIGAAAGSYGMGAGVGAGAGAAAGLIGVLLTRGPEATLTKGSTVEMVLDRPLSFNTEDVDFKNAPAHATLSQGDPTPQSNSSGRRLGIPGTPF